LLCLGLEAASLSPGVGLADERGVIAEVSESRPASKAQAIFVYLGRLVESGRLDLSRLDLLAVTAGPGSFTGLKVGLAAAKGLGLALGLRIAPVSSLAALARGAAEGLTPGRLICPLLDARRGLIYTALFRLEDGRLTRLNQDAAAAPEKWALELAGLAEREPILLAGEGLAAYGRLFRERLAGRVEMAPEPAWTIRPGQVARLGLEAAGQGLSVDAAGLRANYLRPVEIRPPARPLTSL